MLMLKALQTNPPARTPAIFVEVSEWEELGPAQYVPLKGTSLAENASAQRLATSMRDWIDVRPGYDGLEIATTSFVGRVDVGPIRIAVVPKLPAMPLARLLRYA
jgi:5-methylcytosine-specific restriction enzyme subunit McrC